MDEIARREFVKGAALGAFAFTVGGAEVLLTPRQARAQGAAMRVLKPEEAQTLEAIGETLAIGARQYGIAHFVDSQLAVSPEEALLTIRVTETRPPYVNFYRAALEVDVGRSRFGHPDGEQRLLGRDRELAVDEMRDAVLPCPDRERLADRFERLRFLGLEHAHGRALGARLPWGEQNLGAADRKGECAERRALDEFSPRNLIHGVPPSLPYASPAPVGRSLSRQ